ncbi:MAG: bifunctional precorrin-2 dehydrogenase/sirohydrochlorin ferrochelatase [Isosphaeraceae bacterium]
MNGYPIELDLRGCKTVVVGLGRVGLRKAKGLIAAEARVIGIDPHRSELLEGVEIVPEPYRAEHLNGARLAFAAATPEINRQVVRDANSANILVNSASEPALGNFRLPISRREGPIVLTVSTSGASPALARRLIERLAGTIDPGLGRCARILGELRQIIINRYDDIRLRRKIFDDWTDLERLELIAREEDEAIRFFFLERAERIAQDRDR